MLEGIRNFFTNAASAVTGGGGASGLFNTVSGLFSLRGAAGAGLGLAIAHYAMGASVPMKFGMAAAGYAVAHFLPSLFGGGQDQAPAPAATPATQQAPQQPLPAPAPAPGH